MNNTNQPIINKLNSLISFLEDGKMGYESAAVDVSDNYMKALFQRLSEERAMYVTQLQGEVRRVYGEAENDGGPVGALHRVWIDMKSLFTSGDKEAIVNACITGEEAVIKEYNLVLEETDLKEPLRQLIGEQLRGITGALASIKSQIPAEV